jgi:hypothetical protein
VRVIKPKKFENSMLISSTATADIYPEFSISTNYLLGNRVVCPVSHKIYESIRDNQYGNQPYVDVNALEHNGYIPGNYYTAGSYVHMPPSYVYMALTSGTLGWPDASPAPVPAEWEQVLTEDTVPSWQVVRPANKYAMFDDQISTQTFGIDSMEIVLETGSINSLALVGLQGSELNITIENGTTEIFNETISLDATVITDWYQYYYEEYVQASEIVLTDLPSYSQTTVTITLTGSGTVAIGGTLFGSSYFLGDTEYGATAGIVDYSTKDTDEFGTTTFVKRDFAKRMSARLMLDNVQLRKVQSLLSNLRATPCVWIGTDDETYSPLVVYGFYREFSLEISYPTKSYCSLDIEGLT